MRPTAPSPKIDAFVELLREPHRALRGEAELARGFLLQRGGGERRRRVAACAACLSIVSRPAACRCAAPCDASRSTSRAVPSLVKRELLDLLAVELDQLQREAPASVCSPSASSVQYSCGMNFAISSSRSQIMRSAGLCTRPADSPRRHLLPQQRREVEADQVVERAARLLRVHQVHRQIARGSAIASLTALLVIS